jgi:benzoyl-CoA reductase/2-hydroxyglutaryl-CoA dehydratase subunit BcrC/BadD/HgdB
MYAPVELIDASGMVPFGLWGAKTELALAKTYFPPFLDSVVQTTLDLGLRGDLAGLVGLVVPHLTDSLKCLGQNWQAGVAGVPMLPLVQPQNLASAGAEVYLRAVYQNLADRLAELSGQVITDQALNEAIEARAEQRMFLQRFCSLAANCPDLISPSDRSAVLVSRHYLACAEHVALLRQVLVGLAAEQTKAPGRAASHRVTLSGLMASDPGLLSVLEECRLVVVGDDLAQESGGLELRPAVGSTDPLGALVRAFLGLRGVAELHDPSKNRVGRVVELARQTQAQGVVFVQTQFWEPDEFDLPLIRRAVAAAGLPFAVVEADLTMANYERARTVIETFADLL